MFSQFWNSNTQPCFKGRYFKSFNLFQASLHALHSSFYLKMHYSLVTGTCVYQSYVIFFLLKLLSIASQFYLCFFLHRWQTLVGFIVLRLLVITKHVPAMLTETQRLEHLSPCDLIAFKAFSNCASDNTADIVIIFVLGKENEYCKH